MNIPKYEGSLRKLMVKVPESINECSGIEVFGRVIRSIVFTTDVSIVANSNGDAVISVYPFSPQPVITQALLCAASVPVFAGIGGGFTKGNRVVELAKNTEIQGAAGVVLNPRTPIETITEITENIDLPVIATVVSEYDEIDAYIRAGASILNVSAAERTTDVIKKIRADFPDVAIIATGGPSDETIRATIAAGANAITWTPPSCASVFKVLMDNYRLGMTKD